MALGNGKESTLEVVSLDDLFGEGSGESSINILDGFDKDGNVVDSKGGDNTKGDAAGSDEGTNAGTQKQEPALEEPKPDPAKTVSTSGTNYKDILKGLAERGIIDDPETYEFEVGDDKITLDKMDLSDPDKFFDVVSSIIKNKEESLLQNKIDASSVSDFTKQLIEAEKSGANVADIVNKYKQYQAPVQDIDLSEKQDQLKLIKHYLGLLPNLPSDEAQVQYELIAKQDDDFIEERAKKYKEILDKQFNEYVQKQKEVAEAKKAEDIEKFKKYRKDLKTSLAGAYQLNDKMINKAMDFVIKGDEHGVTPIKSKFMEMLQDPQKAPDLVMFLMDPTEFIKQKSFKALKEERTNTIKLIGRTNKTRGEGEKGKDKTEGPDFINIEEGSIIIE